MTPTRLRFLRGLIGTSVTWGVAWAAFNTLVLFVRYVASTPEGVTRSEMVLSILSNQSIRALAWGCVVGAIFSLSLAIAARRWPAANPLRTARLATVGAVAGFVLPALMLGFGSWLNVAGVALCSTLGASIGAGLARMTRSASALCSATVRDRLSP